MSSRKECSNIRLAKQYFRALLIGMVLFISHFQHADAETTRWQSGLMLDFSYAESLNSSQPVTWRSKLTTNRLNQLAPNMGMAYIRKLQDAESSWGMELALQGGYDTDGQVPDQQRIAGYSWLRYLARANMSYRLPVGNGLNITAGLMNSFIGLESMWSRDNNHYTRSWMADYSPYYLIGIGGQYPVNDDLQLAVFLLNDYDYLADRTSQPKYATQLIWSASQHLKFTQNVFAGSEERADPSSWRYFSNTILQWTNHPVLVAWAFDSGTQAFNQQQAFWLASMLSGRWQIQPRLALALRPELYWDADGLMTGQKQLIKGATATFEYKAQYESVHSLWRLEYRFDDANGRQAGFYAGSDQKSLIGQQQLLLFSCVLSFDSQ